MIELDFTTRNQQPYSNIGTLVTTWSEGSESIGTFSLVGRNDLLTAAHFVYDPDVGGWATGWGRAQRIADALTFAAGAAPAGSGA